MDTTNTNIAPMTRREAREIERRTGVRPVVGSATVGSPHDTGEIARAEIAALLSAVPAPLAPTLEPIASPSRHEVNETPRGMSVRAAVPAAIVAQRRARTAGVVFAAASVGAVAVFGASTLGSTAVATPAHQADLLVAVEANGAQPTEPEVVVESDNEVSAPVPAVPVGEDTTVVTVNPSAVAGLGESVAVPTETPESAVEAAETPDAALSEESTAADATEAGAGSEELPASAPSAEAEAESTADPAPAPAPVASDGSIISIAEQYLGVPYVFGGTTPAGFDCAGYVSYVLNQAGYSTTNSISALASLGPVTDNPQPGDLVVYGGYHIGFYAGPNDLLHAPYEGDVVRHGNMDWDSHYYVSLHG